MPLSRTGRRRNVLIPSGTFALGGILLGIAVLVLLIRLLAPGALTTLGTPLWTFGNQTAKAVGGVTSVFGNGAELTRERDQLVAENLALTESNRTLTGQVADLTKLIGTEGQPEKRILAGVLARPPVSPYDTLIVDAGRSKGVQMGVRAYGPGGVPLGTISSVTNSSATIQLYSTGGNVVQGWIGDNRVPVTLTGRGGGAFEATLPRDSGIQMNAVVYVPGPGALPIGTVVRIDSNPSSPRDIVHIAPYANVFSITWVELSSTP